ncbi:MAG: hypothetical protein AAGD23_08860 [Pseudomonadota bacterium]
MLNALVFIFVAPVITGLSVLAIAIRETSGPLGESAQMMIIAAAIGFVASFPVTMFVTKQIRKATEKKAA